MTDIKALEAPLHEDLRELSHYWRERGFAHRINERSGVQIVWTGDEATASSLRTSYRFWQEGKLPLEQRAAPAQPAPRPARPRWRLPVTAAGIVLSVLGFLLVTFERQLQLVYHFTFFMPLWNGRELVAVFPLTQPWRLLTPAFLHFSLLHIVFNMLWYWDLGGRIERHQGSGRLLMVVLVSGVGANLAQALFTPGGLFGGMSGVIYALLGYCWVWGTVRRRADLAVPRPVMIAMMVWLLVCIAGFTELMGLGAVANAAHVGGLAIGLALGGVTALLARR
jgi:GlpG protein